jgi:twitching motility protein PilT
MSIADLPSTSTAASVSASTGNAGLTATSLIESLIKEGVFREVDLPKILGPARHKVSIATLEQAINTQSLMREEEILARKVALSGYKPADTNATPVPTLSGEHAKKLLAVTLHSESPRPVVAFVDPSPGRIKAASQLLQVSPNQMDVRVTTLKMLTRWLERIAKGKSALVINEQTLPDIWSLLDLIIAEDGSDLHLTVGESPAMRVHGEMQHLPTEPVSNTWIKKQLQDLTGRNLTEQFDGFTDVNEAVSFGKYRFRLVIAKGRSGPTLVARKLSETIVPMEQLNLPESVKDFVNLERGLVLVTGPTGSGKSTTLASIIQEKLKSHPCKVITLEHPVEYKFTPGRGTVDQREVSKDVGSFAHGVVQSLRQDPDVIFVGEMRDPETVRAAVEAAETGHLVFSTLHTFDAASALQRIVDFFDGAEQVALRAMLAYVLKGVVAQSLLPSLSGGRVAAFEVLIANTAIRNNLSTPEGMRQIRGTLAMGSAEGMMTMEQSLVKLVRDKQVSREAAEFKAQNKDEFNRLLDG